jgi:hypothetical protein
VSCSAALRRSNFTRCGGSILQGLAGVAFGLGACAAIVPGIAVTPLTPLMAALCAAGLGLLAPGAVVAIVEECDNNPRAFQVSPAPEDHIAVDWYVGDEKHLPG